MRISAVRPIAASLIVGSICVTAVACGDGDGASKGPTVGEAGISLRADITNMLHRMAARNVQVVDSGSTDTRCRGNGVQRRYFVTATKSGVDGRNGLAAVMIGDLNAVSHGKYKIVNQAPGRPRTKLRSASEHTWIQVDAPKANHIQVTGYTDCMARDAN